MRVQTKELAKVGVLLSTFIEFSKGNSVEAPYNSVTCVTDACTLLESLIPKLPVNARRKLIFNAYSKCVILHARVSEPKNFTDQSPEANIWQAQAVLVKITEFQTKD